MVFTLLVLARAPVATAADPDLQARVQAELDRARAEAGFPGVTAAIALPDGRVVVAASGLDPAARMPAGSVGKTFVAAAILQAVDEGVLDLDAPIARWVGEEPWFPKLPNAQDLTLRLLLSHRSGVPDPDQKAFLRAITERPDRVFTPPDLLAFLVGRKPRARAGTTYFYADANYVLAGAVFEKATHRALFPEIERRLLSPGGLADTAPTERGDLKGVVPGRLDPKGPLARLGIQGESIRDGHFVYAAQAEYAGGGLISSARDLARWAKRLWEGNVFSSRQLAQMLDAKPTDEKGVRYGLGVEISSTGAGPVYGHDGWIFGYLTQIVYFPDFKVAVALQINSDPMKQYKNAPGNCLGRLVSLAIHDLKASK